MSNQWEANRRAIDGADWLKGSIARAGGVKRLADWWTAVDVSYLLRAMDMRRYSRDTPTDRRVKLALYEARLAIQELNDALRARMEAGR